MKIINGDLINSNKSFNKLQKSYPLLVLRSMHCIYGT